MPARLMKEWQAYGQLEPFGPPAAFWQAGLGAAMTANVNRTKKTQKALGPEDFMPETMTGAQERGEAEVGERFVDACRTLAAVETSRRGRR